MALAEAAENNIRIFLSSRSLRFAKHLFKEIQIKEKIKSILNSLSGGLSAVKKPMQAWTFYRQHPSSNLFPFYQRGSAGLRD